MDEPMVIAGAAAGAATAAYKISCNLHELSKGARKVETSLELLYTAVVGLEAPLKNVEATLRSRSVIRATKNRATYWYAGSLKAIECSLQDCEHTLRAFSDVLPGDRSAPSLGSTLSTCPFLIMSLLRERVGKSLENSKHNVVSTADTVCCIVAPSLYSRPFSA